MASVFKGPQFYLEEESSIFKGREKETTQLLDLVEHSDFSVCYAVSGEGKSSLINAGLCPKLRDDGFLPIHIKNITEAENGNFDDFVWMKVKESINEERKKERYSELSMLKLEPKPDKIELYDSVWWKLRTREFRINSFETVTPILIFDQFEEVFGSAKNLSWIDSFFSWLEKLYQDENPIAGGYSDKLHKKFKILFSLRSEYVCELDYWAMNKYFIPPLKNNRYYLKPLTKGAALEVTKLLNQSTNTIDDIDIVRYAKAERVGDWDHIKDDTPCVSALILSLVLTGLNEENDEVKSQIDIINSSSNENHGKEIFDFLLENVYKRALHESGEGDNKEIKDIIETLEDSLIDINGRRRHVEESELPSINDENISNVLKILKKERIINVVDHRYEISHDSICQVILKRKETRLKIKKIELQKIQARAQKLKEQREDAFSGIIFLIVLVLFIWIISAVYQDKVAFLELLDIDDNKIVTWVELLPLHLVLGNLTVIPFLIYSAIKKLKITSWLAFYGITSNVCLLFFCFYAGIRNSWAYVLMFATIVIPGVIILYSHRFRSFCKIDREELRLLFSSIPILSFFLLVSIYLFYLCVFNKELMLPEPHKSSWGIMVIPLLLHELIRSIGQHPHNKNSYNVIIILLCLLTYNTVNDELKLSYYFFIIVLCAICVNLLILNKIRCFRKRVIAFLFESASILLIVMLNLGFRIDCVKYNSVTHVYNWQEVMVNDTNGCIGLVDACNGDTLIPCVFDSLDTNRYMCLTTDKLCYDESVKDYKDLYNYEKETGISSFKCLYIPSSEHYINNVSNWKKMNVSLVDSMLYYAANSYFELRNANISYFIKGGTYSLGITPSLTKLFKLQLSELYNSLDSLDKYKDNSGEIGRIKVVDFNKSLARSFYLCLLIDRLAKKDSVEIYTLCQEILPLYFYDSSNFELTIKNNYDITFGDFSESYGSKIRISELRSNTDVNSWFNYFEQFALLDMSLNSKSYLNSYNSKVQNIITDTYTKIHIIEQSLKNQNKALRRLDKYLQKDSLSMTEMMDALKLSMEQILNNRKTASLVEYTKQTLGDSLSTIGVESIQIDLYFREVINKVFMTLPMIVSNTSNVYNANLKYICQLLYMVSTIRLYDMSSVYLLELKNIDRSTMKIFDNMRKMEDESTRQIQRIKNELEKIK